MQEEAAFFGVPCLVLRDVTERQEGVDIGVAKLLPLRSDVILREVQVMLKYNQGSATGSSGKRPSSKVSLTMIIVIVLVDVAMNKLCGRHVPIFRTLIILNNFLLVVVIDYKFLLL